MNKKILVIPILLLTFVLLSIPVMAKPATKIDVTMTVVSGPPTVLEAHFVSDDTIRHSRGEGYQPSTVTLDIPGVGTYSGNWATFWMANGNYKKGEFSEFIIISKNTMTFAEGTFVGVNQRRITGPSPMLPTTLEDYCVWKGTGMFKGWTLKTTTSEGYVIIPK